MKTYPPRKFIFPQGSVGVEIGVYRGFFSQEILECCNPAKLALIDVWKHQKGDYELDSTNVDDGEHETNYREVCAKFAVQLLSGQVSVHRMFSHEAAPCFQDGSLDWAYIDACHLKEAVLADLTLWAPKVKIGGFLAGHDYQWQPAMKFGVIEAVQEFCDRGEWYLDGLTDEGGASYVLKRRK